MLKRRLFSQESVCSPTERLTGIQNTQQGFTLSYAATQTLYSPFAPSTAFGTTRLLTQVRDALNLAHNFQYGSNGSGEITRVILPYGGDLRWDYRDFTYAGNRTLREVQTRSVTPSSGDASRSTHLWTTIDDATGGGRRKWTFDVNTASAYYGRPVKFEQFALPSATLLRQEDFTWTTDTTGRPYVASVLTTIDPGTAFTKQSKAEQTLDSWGNVTQRKLYDFGNLTTPARTYTYTYLATSSYLNRYIANRLLSASVSDGAQSFTLVTNVYDSYASNPLIDRPGIPGHDGAYNTGFTTRGNVTTSTAGAISVNYQYDITGTIAKATRGSSQLDVTPDSTVHVPTAITPNSNQALRETLNWDQYLRLTQDTKPNNATSSFTYDVHDRPTSTTSPHGAVTNFTYTNSPPTSTATTNGRWTKTTSDGLGRVIKVEAGDSGGATMTFIEMFSYTAAGAVTKKRQRTITTSTASIF